MDANSVVVAREVSGYWPEIIGALITGISILLAAIIGAKYGLLTYFRKREHEIILKRYIDEGIDRLSELIDNASQVFIYNYKTAHNIVSKLESLQEANLSSVKFRTIQAGPEFTPYSKLTHLVGDNAFVLCIQKLLIFVDSQCDYLDSYFRSLVLEVANILRDNRDKDSETLMKMSGELVKVLNNHLDEDFDEFNEFSSLTDNLQMFALILEKETNLTWAYVSEFRNRNEIKQSVEMVKKKLVEPKEERLSKLE